MCFNTQGMFTHSFAVWSENFQGISHTARRQGVEEQRQRWGTQTEASPDLPWNRRQRAFPGVGMWGQTRLRKALPVAWDLCADPHSRTGRANRTCQLCRFLLWRGCGGADLESESPRLSESVSSAVEWEATSQAAVSIPMRGRARDCA